MKKKLYLLLTLTNLFCCSLISPVYSAVSDRGNEAIATDNAVRRRAFGAPSHAGKDAKYLAQYLTRPFKSDYDKLKVIAYWIASHLAYDHYKFDNDQANMKEMKYKYDVLKAKMGICSDFAKLFTEMAQEAGVSAEVETVGGYVITPQRMKRHYNKREITPAAHAWNEITLQGRKFFVDTTFMCPNHIGHDTRKRKSSLKHRNEVRARNRERSEANVNIDTFYFDSPSSEEFKAKKEIHLLYKYVR